MTTGPDIIGRVTELDAAVEALARSVQDLTRALSTVNELDAQQQEFNRQLPIALADARQALDEKRLLANQMESNRKRIEELARDVIPKEEQRRNAEFIAHNKRMIRRWVVYPATLTLAGGVVFAILVLASQHHTIGRLSRDERSSAQQAYQACLIRNKQTQMQASSAAVVVPLLRDVESALPDTAAKQKVILDIDRLLALSAKEPATQVDCANYPAKVRGG